MKDLPPLLHDLLNFLLVLTLAVSSSLNPLIFESSFGSSRTRCSNGAGVGICVGGLMCRVGGGLSQVAYEDGSQLFMEQTSHHPPVRGVSSYFLR